MKNCLFDMKILIVSVVYPYPADAGGSAGTFKMIDYLRKSAEITLLCPHTNPKDHYELQTLWPNVDIKLFGADSVANHGFSIKETIKKVWRRRAETKEEEFKNSMLFFRTGFTEYYFDNLIDQVKSICKRTQFDLAVVEFIDLAPIVAFLPANLSKVFVHHEIRHRRMELEFNTLENKPIGGEWKIFNTKLLEVALLNRFDKVICLTDQDKIFLEEDGVLPEKIEVSPLSVQITDHNINIPFSFTNRLVYLGPEIHFPNLDAVDWFLTNCWTSLKNCFPDLQFEVVGKWKKETRTKYEKLPGVKFHGYVEELDEVLEGAIMVVPLRIGSGMRMKILEGASWHMPIVSTPIGAEGLPMENGHNCFLAEKASDFVEAVGKLIENKELQVQFIENSKEIIRVDYSIEDCGKRRLEIFENLVATNAG